MALQTLALSLSVGMASGRRRIAAAALVCIGTVVVLAGAFAVVRSAGAEPRETLVRAWLHALANDPADRGWSYLDPNVRAMTDRDAYLADASAVDWSTFGWQLDEAREHDGAWSVHVLVEGGLASTPDLFFDHQIVFPYCAGDEAPGFGVWVEVPLIGPASLGGGGFSDRRTCARAEPEAGIDPVRWGNATAWTGFALELWNRTTMDLFLVDRNGSRVELPACGRASTNALDLSQVQVRAEGGYVFAFGTGDLDETTTYVVIMAGEPSMNGTPPVPPLPPCEGEPQVQVGV